MRYVLTDEIVEAMEAGIAKFPSQNDYCRALDMSKRTCRNIRQMKVMSISAKTFDKISAQSKVKGRHKPLTRTQLEELGLDHQEGGARADTKIIEGRLHKWCSGLQGKSHKPRYVPISNFYPAKTKIGVRSECMDCTALARGTTPDVKFTAQYRMWVNEIIYRVGHEEAARQIGISSTHLREIKNRPGKRIRKSTAQKIVKALAELRRNNVARHRDSIKHGAYLRGKKEKIPTRRKDFNGPDDHATQSRRDWGRKNPEKQKLQEQRAAQRKTEKRRAERAAITA